jgi:hypothetical protein
MLERLMLFEFRGDAPTTSAEVPFAGDRWAPAMMDGAERPQ